MDGNGYVVITPARDEDTYISHTLESVTSQTILPLAWIVVDDGSVDSTAAIVRRYCDKHSFIQLVSREADLKRNFASKVYAIRAGYSLVKPFCFDYVAVQDADCSLPEDYFQRVLEMFHADPTLGIAGGIYYEIAGKGWLRQRTNPQWSVTGGVQMFRRACYEEMGGYVAIRGGMEDAIAEISARMNDWKVKANPDLHVRHYRLTGKAEGHILRTRYLEGWQEYLIGYHPIFVFMKQLSRLNERPVLVGSVARIVGYIAAYMVRSKRPVGNEFVAYLQREQLRRIWSQLPCCGNTRSSNAPGLP